MRKTALAAVILLATGAQAGPILNHHIEHKPPEPGVDLVLPPVEFLIEELLAEFDSATGVVNTNAIRHLVEPRR